MFKKNLLIIPFLILIQQGLNANITVGEPKAEEAKVAKSKSIKPKATEQRVTKEKKVTEKDVINAINKGVESTKKFLKKVPTYQLYKNENTILHYAVRLNKYAVVEYLVDKVDLSNKGGIYYQTALQDAIFYGNLRIAELLITSGTNLDIKNIDGETALHIAAKYGHADIIKMLIDAGASLDIRDEEGHTPKDVLPEMMWENKKEIVQQLEVKEKEDEGIQATQSKKIIIKSTNGNINSVITIDPENKTIFGEKIDNKSNIQNSDIGIVID